MTVLGLPPVWSIKRKWLRRAYIVVLIPYDIFLAVMGSFRSARVCWNTDPSVYIHQATAHEDHHV